MTHAVPVITAERWSRSSSELSTRTKNRWQYPLTIKGIILDLDGTIYPSYKTLEAIYWLARGLKIPQEAAENFITACLQNISFQNLLHVPQTTLEAARAFAAKYNITMTEEAFDLITNLQRQSFRLYPGVRELLGAAKKAGCFVGIYTNSPACFATHRLAQGLGCAENSGINAVWAKQSDASSDFPSRTERSLYEERSYAGITIHYSYQKPNSTPMIELMELGGIKPAELLVIGEGTKDLESVYMDKKNPAGIFCFQAHGARDIGVAQRDVNSMLRPGAEPLGYDAVEQRLNSLSVERDIIRLDGGIPHVNDFIIERRIILEAPLCLPYVYENGLAVLSRSGSMRRANFLRAAP